ncbi:MAG TPA: hypothetical protein VGM51_00740 [Armatimonadota bacterium]|jgi:hypothetical protein
MRCRLAIIVGLAFAASASNAADDRLPPGAPVQPPLIRALQRTMAGRPVIGVALPCIATAEIPTAFGPDEGLLPRLQAIGDAASAPGLRLIPFAVGSAWALAPETREEFRLPDPNARPLEYMDRRSSLMWFLAALTPEQIGQLGSADGLPARDLRGAPRAALLRALQPPLIIAERQEPVKPAAGEGDFETPVWRDVRRVDDPLDASSLRVFARLQVREAYFRTSGDQYVSLPVVPPPDERALRGDRAGKTIGLYGNLEIPCITMVANRYKPSDLTGGTLRQPIGLEGVHTVKEVVEAASRATGLTLHVIPMWKDIQVFVGSKTLPSGDVMDTLRLALEGAWRKVGSEYVLAWDVRGLAPLQRSTIESLAGTSKRTEGILHSAYRSGAWISMARSLMFDEDNSLSLTREQRDIILPEIPAGYPTIGYEQMTPYQQAWVQTQARTRAVTGRTDSGAVFERAISRDEVRATAINSHLNIIISVEEPSVGRLRLDPEFGSIELIGQEDIRRSGLRDAAKLFPVTPEMMNSPGISEEAAEPKDEDGTDEDQSADPGAFGPAAIPSQERAVMVPPTGPATLGDLAATMRRHGFNTLFYPVLYDGYSTIPSAAFPLHPALRGKDGLDAAFAAMAGSGIQVVPYLNTLTWRGPDQPSRVLRKHPGWLERDILGRCRSEWLVDHPLKDGDRVLDVAIDRDYVRGSDPAVASLLQTLLKELSARQAVTGLAFSDWLPERFEDRASSNGVLSTSTQPPMGFAAPDRSACLRETGMDPVDLTLWWDPPFMPRTMSSRREDNEPWGIGSDRWNGDESGTIGPAGAPHPDARLISALLGSAKDLRPDWETYLFDASGKYPELAGGPESSTPRPDRTLTLPDHTIGLILSTGEHADGVCIPLASQLLVKAIQAPDVLKTLNEAMDGLRRGEWRDFEFHISGPDEPPDRTRYAPPYTTVLNFQRMPESIRDTLRLFRPPTPNELAPPKVTSATKKFGPGH